MFVTTVTQVIFHLTLPALLVHDCAESFRQARFSGRGTEKLKRRVTPENPSTCSAHLVIHPVWFDSGLELVQVSS